MQAIVIFLICLSIGFFAIAVAMCNEFIRYRTEIKHDEIRDARVDELLAVDREDWGSTPKVDLFHWAKETKV